MFGFRVHRGATVSVPCVFMSRNLRTIAMAAGLSCIGGLLTAGAAATASAAPSAGATSDHDPLLAYMNPPR